MSLLLVSVSQMLRHRSVVRLSLYFVDIAREVIDDDVTRSRRGPYELQAARIGRTHFEAFGLHEPKTADPGPNARFRPWWETWTLVGCGRKFDVPINFIPDERGTTIAQALGDVKAR